MVVNIPGLIGTAVFYVVILIVGLIAGRKNKKGDSDDLLVAGRNLGLFVATLTNAATMVGGAYINGTAEIIGRDGLFWTIGPIGYNISLLIAALVYVPKVREANYTTIFDPLQEKYGNRTGGLLFIPELLGDLFWEAAILAALGSTLSIILGLEMSVAVIISASIAVFYTFFGGLYSVAYTDVVQMFFIAIGLIMIVPFAVTNSAVDLSKVQETWLGEIDSKMIGVYVDTCLLTIGGCVTWQAFYQRILACKSVKLARNSAILGTILSLSMAVPPAIVGIVGASTDWNQTAYPGNGTLAYDEWGFILPMVIEYLCPVAVSVIGLGAVSAAVMSSTDSIVLATGSVFSRNIYRNCFRPQASDRELKWVLRMSILIVGALGSIIAISANSVYGLYILCGDAMYIVQMPILTCALWIEFANTYGALTGFVVGTTLRVVGGEPVLSFVPILKYPWYDEQLGQLFPFKTFSMLCCLFSVISVSYITCFLFTNKVLPSKYDILKCYSVKRKHIGGEKTFKMDKFEISMGEDENSKFITKD